MLDTYLFPASTHVNPGLQWEATCEGKQSNEESGLNCNVILAILLFDCLISFVGLETNEQQTHMPRI